MKQMIDIGLNLTSEQFHGDELNVLARAKEAGVQQIILTGSNVEESIAALEIAKQHEQILYATAGVHPHDARLYTEETTTQLKKMLQHPQVVALGECGLDFDRKYSIEGDQYFAFESQLQIAQETKLPLFLHEREAHQEFIATMKKYEDVIPRSVVHCFTGDKVQLKNYLDLGFYIGVTGWVCDPKRGEDLREALKYMPLDRLMIETDGPYLLPKDYRPKPKSRRNESMYLPHIGRTIAEIMSVEEETFFEAVTCNTKQFFNLNK